ncbi:MAG: DUF2489 domain-containing protein [Saccharospirillum sp.]|nr:DUF2489 domain-containing protein [Saccharospirillum sp.]
MSTPILLLIAAVIIIAGLAVTAWRLQQRVRQQQRHLEAQQALVAQKKADRQAFALDSLRIISSNVIEEDLNLSEATIRCKVLIDALELNENERQPYEILDVVYEKVQHFATHQARKDLNRAERERQDAAREAIEADHQQDLISCFKRLRHIQLNG